MIATDACVCPFPRGDSSVRRLALEARELGFDSIVIMNTPVPRDTGFRIIEGRYIRAGSIGKVKDELRGSRNTCLVAVEAGDATFNRALVGIRGVKLFRGLHRIERHAFDHVTAREAERRGIGIDIEIGALIRLRGVQRQRAIERYRDLARLQDHFGFTMTLSSGARSILELRRPGELAALCSLFGMENSSAEEALGGVGRLLSPSEPVRVV